MFGLELRRYKLVGQHLRILQRGGDVAVEHRRDGQHGGGKLSKLLNQLHK